jgi:hypothetical protein
MKPFLLLVILTVLTMSVFHPDPASAAKGNKPGKGAKAKPTPVPEKVNASGSKIAKVGGDSITVEYSKTSTTYKMSAETQITLDGNKARSTDLRAGMHAEVSPSAITPNLLLSIRALSVPKS